MLVMYIYLMIPSTCLLVSDCYCAEILFINYFGQYFRYTRMEYRQQTTYYFKEDILDSAACKVRIKKETFLLFITAEVD